MSIKQVKPKIITLQTPCIRNQRTLVWLQNQSHVNWSKWDAVVTSLEAYYAWYKKANIVGIIIDSVPKKHTTFYEDLYAISPLIPMIFLSNRILSTKTEAYWADNYDNILNLDEIHISYPFLGHAWNGSLEDAVGLVAHLSRYNRIVDCVVPMTRFQTFDGHITVEHEIVPPNVILVTQYFRHSNAERAAEIKECLRRNSECADISQIVLLTERDYSKDFQMMSQKIRQIIIKKRLTYAHFLQYVKERIPKNTIVILANADIYVEDLLDLWKINMKNAMLSLLRWDVTEDGTELFGPRADSQDTWIVLSDSIKEVEWTYEPFDVQLGQLGCDNAFAGLMLRNHFVLYNPALSLKTYHLHQSQIRNYTREDAIRTSLYVNIVPSYIIDTKHEKDLEKCTTLSNELVVFEVRGSSTSNEITYCTMLAKEGRYKWEASIENFYFDEIPVYRWSNACVAPTGLVYKPYTIYPGNDEQYPYWTGSNVTIFTPLESVEQMIAIPFPDMSVFSDPDRYHLYYLARVLRLLKQYPRASFWTPSMKYLDGFQMEATAAPLLVTNDIACYAKEVIGFVPGPLEVGKEDIAVLRKYLPSWIETPCYKRCVVIGGSQKLDKIFYKDWCIEYQQEATYESLVGAALCIVMDGVNALRLWALPKGACVIEFQQELEVRGDLQHLAHVCELRSWVLLLSKGDIEKQIEQELSRWLVKHEDEIKV